MIHGDHKLDNYTEESFTKYITSMFTNSNVYDNGKMKSMNGGQATGRGCATMTGDKNQVICKRVWMVLLALSV